MVGDAEGLNALLVGQQVYGAGPVGAPHATVQGVGVEDLCQWFPNVSVGERFVRECSRAGYFDSDIVELGEFEDGG